MFQSWRRRLQRQSGCKTAADESKGGQRFSAKRHCWIFIDLMHLIQWMEPDRYMSLPISTSDIGLSQIHMSIICCPICTNVKCFLEIIKLYKRHFYILCDVYHFSALIRWYQPKTIFIVKIKISCLSHIFARRCLINYYKKICKWLISFISFVFTAW